MSLSVSPTYLPAGQYLSDLSVIKNPARAEAVAGKIYNYLNIDIKNYLILAKKVTYRA